MFARYLKPAPLLACSTAFLFSQYKATAQSNIYSKADVSKHNSMEQGVWVTFGGKVYDVTDFIDQHPGGSKKLMLAAGGSLEPFWSVYRQHSQPLVRDILSKYEIGQLDEKDVQPTIDDTNPYSNEPQRHPALRVRVTEPFNAETPREMIPDAFITPPGLFFVRNHLPVPVVETEDYSLQLNAPNGSIKLSLDEIKSYPKREIIASVQCAGNRRSDMNSFKVVKGTPWTSGAISNAKWGGARLSDVLMKSGLEMEGMAHVQFEGFDCDPDGSSYGASIPLHTALDPSNDVLVVYEMNGEDLPLDHGFPVRIIVPGHAGARNVKWLRSISLSEEESPSHWQQKDYKAFSASTDWDTADWKKARSIQQFAVQSAICSPEGDMVDADGFTVKGYAVAGGGREIIRVDVSLDGGVHWIDAELVANHIEDNGKSWAWTLWQVDIPGELIKDRDEIELVCKAVDSAYNEQPALFKDNWNFRGLVANAWDRRTIKIDRGE